MAVGALRDTLRSRTELVRAGAACTLPVGPLLTVKVRVCRRRRQQGKQGQCAKVGGVVGLNDNNLQGAMVQRPRPSFSFLKAPYHTRGCVHAEHLYRVRPDGRRRP